MPSFIFANMLNLVCAFLISRWSFKHFNFREKHQTLCVFPKIITFFWKTANIFNLPRTFAIVLHIFSPKFFVKQIFTQKFTQKHTFSWKCSQNKQKFNVIKIFSQKLSHSFSCCWHLSYIFASNFCNRAKMISRKCGKKMFRFNPSSYSSSYICFRYSMLWNVTIPDLER
jgi:hypothetical protein